MKKSILFFLAVIMSLSVNAAEHHSGHAPASSGGAGGGGCVKAHLSKFTPPHLSTVAPSSDFSFIALNINSADQIKITVKNIPVDFDAEFKDPFYLIKAKLPESLKSTYARINIKVSAKMPSCELENGWLVNITE